MLQLVLGLSTCILLRPTNCHSIHRLSWWLFTPDGFARSAYGVSLGLNGQFLLCIAAKDSVSFYMLTSWTSSIVELYTNRGMWTADSNHLILPDFPFLCLVRSCYVEVHV